MSRRIRLPGSRPSGRPVLKPLLAALLLAAGIGGAAADTAEPIRLRVAVGFASHEQ